MIRFKLNGHDLEYPGSPDRTLMDFLRLDQRLTAIKDGCSGQGACGSCTVEIDGRARLACATKMAKLEGSVVFTPEGFPEYVLKTIATALVNEGAVQCGFCTPGFISRIKVLLQNDPQPSTESIRLALKPHLCRCTGYKKIEKAIAVAAEAFISGQPLSIRQTPGNIGQSHPKYQGFETAIGQRAFTDDLFFDGMKYAALKFCDHPKAKILKIDVSRAVELPGVMRIVTAADIPGERKTGLILADWDLMIPEGETTHYIGDVLAGVVADSEAIAREAAGLIDITYEILNPVTDVFKAIDGERVHPERPNQFDTTCITLGDPEKAIKEAAFVSQDHYQTQRVEHAFLEKESAVACPDGENGIQVYSQSQGIYEDRRQIASLLNVPEEKIRVILVSNGGGFGGKEDLSVQGHAALFAHLCHCPVKLTLSRQESIRMHPKRHPVFMDMTLAASADGKLTALRLRAVGDTGAYASVGMKVMERVAGHASGGYFIPNVDIETKTVYTNNIPCGAMRGFGANQVAFALESCIDDLCRKGGFDRWQFRYDNALMDGLSTCTGQVLHSVGIRACLDALKKDFYAAPIAGIACAIKNSGIGNGMTDESKVIIQIESEEKVIVWHGWTEMGQGVHNMAIQTLCQETGIDPGVVEVRVDTEAQIRTGMTTSSRGTALLGLAIIDACKALKKDLENHPLKDLTANRYKGAFTCNWTAKPGGGNMHPIVHYSYGYAAQLCILDDTGKIEKIVAAHDAGRIMNPMLFEGQIEGAVHMGVGYALREELPMKDGYLVNDHMRKLGVLRAHETPEIEVKGIEVTDPVGPYGAKGVGEIGLVPTAAAIANAYFALDGIKRTELPLRIPF